MTVCKIHEFDGTALRFEVFGTGKNERWHQRERQMHAEYASWKGGRESIQTAKW